MHMKSPHWSKRSKKETSDIDDIDISGDNKDNMQKKGKGKCNYDVKIYKWN